MLVAVLSAAGDALAWLADKLLAPILTGVFVGLALRAAAIPGEVSEHDTRAPELNTDLARWVSDRDRQLDREIRREVSTVDEALPGERPHEMVVAVYVERIERLMRQALHEYRDEASRAVRAYRLMARSEGRAHRLLRRRRSSQPDPLLLASYAQIDLAGWRKRTLPWIVDDKPAKASVRDDPTRHPEAAEIRPLEEENGLSWRDAAKATST